MSDYSLAIMRKDLAEALRAATAGVRSSKAGFSVRLEFGDGMLTAFGPGAAYDAQASGTWPQAVLIDGMLMKQLATRLPNLDPCKLELTNGRLTIGGFSVGVTTMDVAPKAIDIVLGASHREVLVAIERHGRPSVIASLGEAAIDKASAARAKSIASALAALKAFQVERGELEAALDSAIRRQAEVKDST
jgi:hypothetical protein